MTAELTWQIEEADYRRTAWMSCLRDNGESIEYAVVQEKIEGHWEGLVTTRRPR